MLRAVLAVLAFGAMLMPAMAGPAPNPSLTVRMEVGGGKPAKSVALKIDTLDIDVHLSGATATTSVTARFLNPDNTAVEGQFDFDPPPGSVITGYALDVDGRMIDGVLQPARKAKLAYERQVRRGIDPGLAEVTRTGAFSTRVFPIMPGKGRMVRLSFATALDRPYVLPLNTDAVGKATIHLSGDAATPPAIHAPAGMRLNWKRTATGFEATAVLEKQPLSGALTLTQTKPTGLTLARHHNGETFFVIDDGLVPWSGGIVPQARLRIYWDSSRSRRGADLAAEIALAEKYVDEIKPQTVDVVFFASTSPAVKSFDRPSGADIAAALKAADYQGGTTFKPLLDPRLPTAEVCLLFSDGNATVDPHGPVKLPCTLFAASAAPDADKGFLRALARASNGDYLDLRALTIPQALAKLNRSADRILSVSDTQGNPLDYQLLSSAGGRFLLIGKLPATTDIFVAHSNAKVACVYAVPTKKDVGDAPAALWAARSIEDLAATDRPDTDAILATARKYSVASPFASFIVLERLEDYIAAGIEPPDSLGETAIAAYRKRRAEIEAREAKDHAERLNNVIALWEAEKLWWNTKFDPHAKPRRPNGDVLESRSSPPPPAPDFAPAAAPLQRVNGLVASDNDVQTVVVTGVRAAADPAISVEIAEWNPKRPYIDALKAAAPGEWMPIYRRQEEKYGDLPAFYLDVAEFLFRHNRAAEAVSVALNALELPISSVETMTVVANRLMRYGDEARALWLYERILYLEPERPQPYRNLALALEARADRPSEPVAARKADYARALDLQNRILTSDWSRNFNGVEVVTLMEANHIIPKLKALGVSEVSLDPRLIAALDVDLRIVLEWNTDGTDMDLWVDEPNGERAMYSNRNTAVGGRLSNDMTNGYGPEEYLLHHAPDGKYTVRADVFATDRLNANGATIIRAHIFRHYGRADEQEQVLEVELTAGDKGGKQVVGTITVKKK